MCSVLHKSFSWRYRLAAKLCILLGVPDSHGTIEFTDAGIVCTNIHFKNVQGHIKEDEVLLHPRSKL